MIKDEDGVDIELTVLKTPIDLNNVDCVHEDNSIKHKRNIRKLRETKMKNKFKKVTVKRKKVKNFENDNSKPISVLKTPLPLNVQTESDTNETKPQITFRVKTYQGTYLCGPSKKRTNVLELKTWKQNALAIFENSYVYPFVHANDKYKCFYCSKIFLDPILLKEHTYKEHDLKDLKEELNNRVKDNLKVDVSCLQCKLCMNTTSNLQHLKVHLKEHGIKIDPKFHDNIIPFKLGDNTFECQVCGDNFHKLRLLIIHMSKHFNNFSCEVCGSVFISLTLLKRHLQTHETGNFPCDKCDKVFTNAAKRTLHVRGVHLKKFPRRCPICPERFNSYYQRTKHLRLIHNQSTGLHRCETCGREYDLKHHLLIHIRSVHLQERNHVCSICHAGFFSKYCLSRHMVIHTGEKKFKCEVCGKAYARVKNLREHSKTHENVQTCCSICGRNCEDRTSLIYHVNTAHALL